VIHDAWFEIAYRGVINSELRRQERELQREGVAHQAARSPKENQEDAR
jgi:hypothetical protein